MRLSVVRGTGFHHGQLIVYANALGRAFPASWAAFGL
jgi:hypothetical protein